MDSTSSDISICKNCEGTLAAGLRFCANCGQKAGLHRLTLHEIGHDTLHALIHVDRSVLSLVRQLALHPGKVALDYVRGRRKSQGPARLQPADTATSPPPSLGRSNRISRSLPQVDPARTPERSYR